VKNGAGGTQKNLALATHAAGAPGEKKSQGDEEGGTLRARKKKAVSIKKGTGMKKDAEGRVDGI